MSNSVRKGATGRIGRQSSGETVGGEEEDNFTVSFPLEKIGGQKHERYGHFLECTLLLIDAWYVLRLCLWEFCLRESSDLFVFLDFGIQGNEAPG